MTSIITLPTLPKLTTPQRLELARQDFTTAVERLRPPQDASMDLMGAINRIASGVELLEPLTAKVPPARSATFEALHGQQMLIPLAFEKPSTGKEVEAYLKKIDLAADHVAQAAGFLASNSR